MSEVLKIQIAADVEKATQDVKRFSSTLNQSMAKAGGSVQTFTKATGQANTALVNFGRVVQDAPFGLIGIANNIDPLVASFAQFE